jgi:hypothetical protein
MSKKTKQPKKQKVVEYPWPQRAEVQKLKPRNLQSGLTSRRQSEIPWHIIAALIIAALFYIA